MTLIQLDIPGEIDRQIKIYSAEEGFDDKRRAVLEILKEFFKEDIKD